MILATASSRFAFPALRGWPLFIALSLLFHLLLLLLLYLFAPEQRGQGQVVIAPIAVQLEAAPQAARTAPASSAPPPPIAKKAPASVAPPAPAEKPVAKEATPPVPATPPPIPERFRNLGTSQRLLDTFPNAGGLRPPAQPMPENAPAQEPSPPQDNDKHLEIESQIRTRFAEHFVYPRLAQTHGWQGEVMLSFRIDLDGSISHVQVVRGSGYAVLDQAALDSMNEIGHIEFTPGTVLHNTLELHLPVIYHLAQG